MRYVWIGALAVTALGIGLISMAPFVTRSLPDRTAASATAGAPARGLVYVSDRSLKGFRVYPAGLANPAPIRTVALASGVISMAVDSRGDLYASQPLQHQVTEFAPGGDRVIREIPTSDSPTGITIDASDDLFVATNGSLGGRVIAFAPNALTPYLTSSAPNGYSVTSVAVSGGTVYAAIFTGNYNTIALVQPQAWVNLDISGCGPSNIAFDATGSLAVAGCDVYALYRLPGKRWTSHFLTGIGTSIWSISRGRDGAMYVAVSGTQPEVIVLPGNSARATYMITAGLTFPQAVAEGPQ